MKIDDIQISANSALLVVDMQNDFLPGGSLAVSEGDRIIPQINDLIQKFHENQGKIIFTQDWHPIGHHSFASVYDSKKPGDVIETAGLGPILWPDHCIQGTKGAEINEKLQIVYATAILRKGYRKEIDSYSAFLENDKLTKTGLTGLLNDLNVRKIFVCGLALDYCCFYTAIDAKKEGFEVFFLQNLTKGIDQPENNIQISLDKMEHEGIQIVQ
ncbi:hypothetical protein NEF87_004546 [Candidatus Lokiarchaeum ossiferum]|uniref:nicotinamidase n=1 Tax=Candidatus Lokiarchaeum ossiferum TaxID=2951803 RepID=A0ABY6HY33_9ARCH|nr:hypothetical protein NEF87_004546 [Candidatus Lokiarchaeum sp. B-35]